MVLDLMTMARLMLTVVVMMMMLLLCEAMMTEW